MLSVLSFNSPGTKLFSKKAHVGTFKRGNGLPWFGSRPKSVGNESWPFRNWTENAGSLKSWFLHGIHFVNQKRNVRAMFHVNRFLGWTPLPESSFFTQGCCSWAHFAWFRPRRVGKQQFYWKKSIGKFGSLSLGFQILIASSDKKELVARCSMLTALCPPIHRENGVSFKISKVNGNSGRGLALFENKNHNFYTRASLLK